MLWSDIDEVNAIANLRIFGHHDSVGFDSVVLAAEDHMHFGPQFQGEHRLNVATTEADFVRGGAHGRQAGAVKLHWNSRLHSRIPSPFGLVSAVVHDGQNGLQGVFIAAVNFEFRVANLQACC